MKRPSRIALLATMVLLALAFAGPFLWLVLTALKGSEDIFAYPPRLLPAEPTLENFKSVWTIVPFGTYLVNSLIVSSAAVVMNLIVSSLAAYPLARMNFRGKKFLFVAIIGTLMVPEQVVMIPVYNLLLELGLLNSLAGVVLPFGANAFGIFLMRQYYKTIPKELDDAAAADGCSPWMIWWKVLIPLSRPALATVAVFTFVGTWSAFLWPLIVLRDTAQYTLPVGLNALIGAFSANYKYLAAGAVLAVLPVLALFAATQRFFIRGILSGSIKG